MTGAKDSQRRAELIERFGIQRVKTHEWTGDPFVDQIEHAMVAPDHYALMPQQELADTSSFRGDADGVVFTPSLHRPPEVAVMVTKLVNEGGARMFIDDAQIYAHQFDIDYLHSNLPDRRALPRKENGYRTAELRDEYIYRGQRVEARREALARCELQFIQQALPASTTRAGKVVILDCKRPFQHCHDGQLPDGSRFEATRIAFPVPIGYTAYRIARTVAEYSDGCMFCDAHDSEKCSVMLISTGATLRCISTCDDCIKRIGPGPDYYRDDDREAQVGYPADNRR